MLSTLSGGVRAAFPASSHDLRTQTMQSQPDRPAERLFVFRDDAVVDRSDAQAVELPSFTFPVRPHQSESMHTERYPSFDDADNEENFYEETEIIPLCDEVENLCTDTADTKNIDYHRLVQQLQKIAMKRATLLDQLQDLHRDEEDILAHLSQAKTAHSVHVQSPPPPSPRPLNAPMLPAPRRSPSKMPRLQPSKASRHLLHSRNRSAPTVSMTVGGSEQGSAANTVKRVPLSEKREEVVTLRGPMPHLRSSSHAETIMKETEQILGDEEVQEGGLSTLR